MNLPVLRGTPAGLIMALQESIKDGTESFRNHWKQEMISGFLVFLIALPLCLGISLASQFPPISGIFTAAVAGLVVTFIGGSHVAIKGPAAGLIVLIAGAVTELGAGNPDPMYGYKLTLAVIVISGIFQTLLGILRVGSFSDFFPTSAVLGILSSIGIIIAVKQLHVAVGVKPMASDPLGLIAEIPQSLSRLNPEIAVIGLVSLLILFVLPEIKNRYVRMIPAPMVVVLLAIPMGFYFDLEHEHKYLFLQGQYEAGPQFLVTLPATVLDGIQMPSWSGMGNWLTWKYIFLFTLVGTLELMLSNKAIDILDPYKRKTRMNKDLIAVGIGNTLCGMIGALPMISEIVRSSANINNGGRTRFANFFHGAFLLLFVTLLPGLIHQIPLAALAAMLIYTGYRLASPKVFKETLHVGRGQLIVFVSTILVTLSMDLVAGIIAGASMELLMQLLSGVKLKDIFHVRVEVISRDKHEHTFRLSGALIFSNYLGLKSKLNQFDTKDRLTLDFSRLNYVDHTVMENLHYLGEDYQRDGGVMKITGMEKLEAMSAHPLADRFLSGSKGDEQKPLTREHQLKNLAGQIGFSYMAFNKTISSNFGKLSSDRQVIKYQGNVLQKEIEGIHYTVSDLSIVSGGDLKAGVSNLTVLSVANLHLGIPIFTMRKEHFLGNAFLNDIDFTDHPQFSRTYQLNGFSEQQIRSFFTPALIDYFEAHDVYTLESLGSELLIYREEGVASPEEIRAMIHFAQGFLHVLTATVQ